MVAKRAVKLLPLLAVAAVLALVAGAVAAQSDAPSPFLGVSIADDPSGAIVVDVLPDGPAADAGIQADDVLTAVDGETVDSAAALSALMADYAIGDDVELDVLRGEETLTLTVTLADRADFVLPTEEAAPSAESTPEAMTPDTDEPKPPLQRAFLGVAIDNADEGVTVAEVVAGSPADAAGLQTGDVLTAINGEAVANAESFVAAVQALAPGDAVTLDYTRDGENLSADITLGATTPGRPGPMNNGQGPRGNNGPMDNNGGRGQGMPFDFDMHSGEIIFYDVAGQAWHVVRVTEDSPLYAAGLRDGDTITAVDGEAIVPDDVNRYLEGLDEDATVTLTIERDGQTQDLTAPASALKALLAPGFGLRGMGDLDGMRGMMPFAYGMPMIGNVGVRLGVTYVDLNEDTAAENDVDVTEGALVNAVDDDSPAADAGLQAGDIITAVDGDVIDEERTLRDRLYAYEPEDTVTLTVLRDGEELQLDATLAEPEDIFHGHFSDEDLLPFLEEHGFQMPGQPDNNDLVPADSPAL